MIRISAKYGNLDLLEDGYGINLVPLARFAMKWYDKDSCDCFKLDYREDEYDVHDAFLDEKMHKAITITTKKVDESTLTTLCAVCRGAFLDAKGVRLRRADPRQLVKDVCTYCQTRYGFDYYVQPIVRKSKMTGKENRRETEPA